MTAKAIVWDGSFGDTSLPQISLGHTSPIPNARFDWAADALALGGISSWNSLVGGATLFADDGAPQVVESGGGPAVRLDGTSDRMRYAETFDGERTYAIVYRFTQVLGSMSIMYGYSGPLTGSEIVTTSGDSGSVDIYGRVSPRGTSIGDTIFPSPRIAADTNWHVLILSITGSTSVIRIDNAETVGTLTPYATDGVTIGYGLTDTDRTPVEYKRLTVLQGGTTASYREKLTQQLAARYGITL